MVAMAMQALGSTDSLVPRAEARRVRASDELDGRRGHLGQFFTPAPIAELLAGMFDPVGGAARMLDAGAGVGSLTAAVVERARAEQWPVELEVHGVEVDQNLIPRLEEILQDCEMVCPGLTGPTSLVDTCAGGYRPSSTLIREDPISWETEGLGG